MNIFDDGRVILVDKPYGWTSFDVVRKLRGIMKIKKVGHAGTLDPLATGLLILCTGKFTKTIPHYMAREKEYTGTLTLGATTPTYDLESAPRDFKSTGHITAEKINLATASLIGEIFQTPPVHSAIKKDGQRAYELARQGKEIDLAPRKILIKDFSITKIEIPQVHFRVVCSTGTYIRSLVNDFGNALECGAFLNSLCRTRIGEFHLTNALTVDAAVEMIRENISQKG